MPFIKFDINGVCNYCNNYTSRNTPKPIEELFNLVEAYRRKDTQDCIVPFSGGRDSCYGWSERKLSNHPRNTIHLCSKMWHISRM